MVWSNHTSGIQESNNDRATDTPAWEANQETQDILLIPFLLWHISVRLISDRVDTWDTLELLSQFNGIVLDHIVIPPHIKPSSMSSPIDQIDGSPKWHEDWESTRQWTCRQIKHILVPNEDNNGEEGRLKDPLLQIVHPFEIDGYFIAIVSSYLFHVDEDAPDAPHIVNDIGLVNIFQMTFSSGSDLSTLRP